MIGPEDVLASRPDLAAVEIDGEVVIYDDASKRLHRLNRTAATVWQCLIGTDNLSEISEAIADVYGVELKKVAAAVLETTRRLVAEGLVAPVNQDGRTPAQP